MGDRRDIERLVCERVVARVDRNYDKADGVRDELQSRFNVVIKDFDAKWFIKGGGGEDFDIPDVGQAERVLRGEGSLGGSGRDGGGHGHRGGSPPRSFHRGRSPPRHDGRGFHDDRRSGSPPRDDGRGFRDDRRGGSPPRRGGSPPRHDGRGFRDDRRGGSPPRHDGRDRSRSRDNFNRGGDGGRRGGRGGRGGGGGGGGEQEEIQVLLEKREIYRYRREFDKADDIRNEMQRRDINLMDADFRWESRDGRMGGFIARARDLQDKYPDL